MLQQLIQLTEHHYNNCVPYKKIIDNLYGRNYNAIDEIPYLPVGLFKKYDLLSVSRESIVRTIVSSGTTGQPSKIFLDDETSRSQSKALIDIIGSVVGNKRIPMIVVDAKSLLSNPSMTARGAGVVGMMNFGARPFFALNDDMTLDINGLNLFLSKYGSSKFLIFGFTFMVWCYFFEQINVDLSNGILIHSGGWKKMIDRKVDNKVFKQSFKDKTGLSKIYNFYGMAEQVGSVFLEGDDGSLHPSMYSDVIVRDFQTMKSVTNKEGIVQVLSVLPKSYPGHSILTEDVGIKNEDGSFSIVGRIPKSEVRGCSDTHEGK